MHLGAPDEAQDADVGSQGREGQSEDALRKVSIRINERVWKLARSHSSLSGEPLGRIVKNALQEYISLFCKGSGFVFPKSPFRPNGEEKETCVTSVALARSVVDALEERCRIERRSKGKILADALSLHLELHAPFLPDRDAYERLIASKDAILERVFWDAPWGVVITHDGLILEANSEFHRMLGYEQGDLSGVSIVKITHPEDRFITELHYQRLLRREADEIRLKKRYIHKSGKVVIGRVKALSLRSQARPPFVLAFVQDITEEEQFRKEVLRRLRSSLDGNKGQ